MNNTNKINLIKLSGIYFFYNNSHISLGSRQAKIEENREKQFFAIALEKSRAAKNWEDIDYFNIIVLVKAPDQKYYLTKIEHPADILSPKHAEDDLNVYWVENNNKFGDRGLISDLYAINDSRCKYTITIDSKPYLFYEKYICYTICASYEIWDWNSSFVEVSPYLLVRCKLSSQHSASDLEDTPTKTLEYRINVNHLLRTSIFQHRPFKIWNGKVTVDGFKIKLIP